MNSHLTLLLLSGPSLSDHWPSWLGVERGRIHWLHLCKGVRLSPTNVLIYNIKPSVGEASIMPELWEIRSTTSLPLFPGSLWPGVVAPDRVLYMSQIELNCNYTKLNSLKLPFFNCIYTKQNCSKLLSKLNNLKRVDML